MPAPFTMEDLERLHDLDMVARVREGKPELTVALLNQWLAERRLFHEAAWRRGYRGRGLDKVKP